MSEEDEQPITRPKTASELLDRLQHVKNTPFLKQQKDDLINLRDKHILAQQQEQTIKSQVQAARIELEKAEKDGQSASKGAAVLKQDLQLMQCDLSILATFWPCIRCK